jgi:predicted dehydrogenase
VVEPASNTSKSASKHPNPKSVSRRKLLQAGTAALAIPYFVSPSALGLAGHIAPSNRITIGGIGTGGKGRHNLEQFLGFADCQVVAVSDVDLNHATAAKTMVNERYGNQDCQSLADFREMCQRADIDAICVSTPDHWHALNTIAALRGGKDVYCEKPLANSVGESKAMRDVSRATGRIVQCGSHERSNNRARYGCELVRSGRLGKIHTVEINLPCDDSHHLEAKKLTDIPPVEQVPPGLDYDAWLGHTASVPYIPRRVHFWWRFNLAYGGGEMTDRGAHIIDLAQLALGMDDSGPIHYDAKGDRAQGSLYDAYWEYNFVNTYANGVRMVGKSEGPRGLKFIGEDGWLMMHIHGAQLECSHPELLEEANNERENAMKLGRSPGHHRDFIDSIKTRKEPFATAEIGHRTATICHLNNLAIQLGRPLKWDPVAEQVIDDAEANGLLTPKMRAPWSLEIGT